jgi:uncharacterized membrane protein YhaH (DUF805 family)
MSAEPLHRLLFTGEVLPGFDPDTVRQTLAQRLRLDETQLAQMFSGRRAVIKRDLRSDVAERWVAQFALLGARMHIDPVPPSPLPAPIPVDHPADAPSSGTPPPAGPPAGEPALFGLSLNGRMSRMRAATANTWLLTAALWVLLASLWPMGSLVQLLQPVVLVTTLVSIRLSVLRLHDMSLSGWWSLVGLVPAVGLVASLGIMCWPGTEGDNAHGPQPPAGSGMGLVVGSLALLLTLLVAVVALMSWLSGFAGLR